VLQRKTKMDTADETRHARQVRAYYDQNTERFLRRGKDEGTANLHGALWPPEVTSIGDDRRTVRDSFRFTV
jgi:hypothetical protein